MADIESAEQAAVNWCMHPNCSGGDKVDICCAVLADSLRKRDAAIRAAAIEECARVCEERATIASANTAPRPAYISVLDYLIETKEALFCADVIRGLKEKPTP